MTQQQSTNGADILRAGHEAFNRRDRDALEGLMAEDITWHVSGNGPAAGTYEGRDTVLDEFFAGLWEAPVHLEDHDILDSDQHVVAIGETVFDLGDEQRSFRVAEVCHYNGDGQITERWSMTEDQAALDAFTTQLMDQMG